MTLPASVQPVTVTGTFLDPAGAAQRGFVTFTPSVPLADVTDSAVIAPVARRYELASGSFTATLAATDSAALLPESWTYTVRVCVQGADPYEFSSFIPHTPSPVDISALSPLQQVPAMDEFLLLSGGQLTGPLYASEPPVQASEVATKAYVDAVPTTLAAKPPVQEATTAPLPASAATSLTLTATFTGALTVDSTAVSPGDRVLVKDEATPANNGIYTVTAPGSAITPWILTRSADMNTAGQVPGAYAYTEQGTVNKGSGFIVAGTGPYVLGTTAITWTQMTGLGEITAGTGLTSSGNTISLAAPVAVIQGGTGSVTQNFVDLSTTQSIAGAKNFTGSVTVPAPVNTTDAVTKAYADAIAQGLQVKSAVQEATNGALPSYTATSSTLTASANGALTIDSVSVSASDRVLVKDETSGNAPNNGIFTVTAAGSVSAAWVLTRSSDMDSGTEVPSAFAFVQAGTVNAGGGFVCTTAGTVTLGTTPITWVQFSRAGVITAGTGLTLTGSTLALSTPVPVSNGGTGSSTAATALTALGAVPAKTIAWDLVHDFGADPTGVTSSVSAMATAITALQAAQVRGSSAQGWGGSTVPSGSMPVLTGPPGAYLIDSTVALPSYMRMIMPGAIFYDPTGLVDMFTTTGFETVISGLRCRGGHRHIYVQTSNVNTTVLRIAESEFNGAAGAAIETDGNSRSTNLILTSPKITTGGSGTRALKLGSGDHVEWNGGWLDGNTDYFIEVTAGALWMTDVLGVPGSGSGAWILVSANANPAFWSMVTVDRFRFGGENPKTLVEWHAAPSATNPTHLSIRGGSQVYIAGKPLAYFYDMPNVTDLANLEGMTGGGWLFTFDSSLPLATKQLIGQETAGGVMVQADRTTDKLAPFTSASDPDTAAAVIAQMQP